MTSHRASRLTAAVFVIAAGISFSTHHITAQGAPPEMRALLDAFVQAFNSGSTDAWESFVQARFAPALVQRFPRPDRDQMYQRLRDEFGTIALGGVQREGPGAPLRMRIKGAKSQGMFIVGVDESAPPFRITTFNVEAGDTGPAAPIGGVPLPPVDKSMTSDEIDRHLDGYFTRLTSQDLFSGVALVARNGVPVFMKAYGFADREKKVPNTIRTRFNLGSINKAFTAIAIRQLAREGKLSMDDTLGKFFPDYPQPASKSATVQQLLTHQAGLSDFFGAEFNSAPKDRFASNADYFKFVSSRPPNFAPGERNQYCNGCFIALGAIVEKVSGMPYEKYVAENVFARAEMTSTGYPRSDQPASDIAIGYTRRGASGGLERNIAMHGVTGSAAGGGYSTALDMLTYVKAVKAGRFPGSDPNMGIAGGAPGINAICEARGEWTVIVLANFDPPTAQAIGIAIADALSR
jgi:D-alanyl-D-alanine carboxypeptidase